MCSNSAGWLACPLTFGMPRAKEAKPLFFPWSHWRPQTYDMSEEDFCADVDAMMLDAPTGTS